MNKNSSNEIIHNISKLEWACRRGMLELDVLLGNFLKEAYSQLSIAQKKQFIALLDYSDTELFAWLMGRETPPERELIKIIEAIRHHARSRI